MPAGLGILLETSLHRVSPASSACEPLTSSCRRRGFSRTSRVSRWSQPPAPAGCGCPARRTHPSWIDDPLPQGTISSSVMRVRCPPKSGSTARLWFPMQHITPPSDQYGFAAWSCALMQDIAVQLYARDPTIAHQHMSNMQCVCPSACARGNGAAGHQELCVAWCILFLCVVVKSIIKCLQLHAGIARQA